MSKIIVLTGATGFVGKKLTLELLKLGYDLRILTRNKNRAQKILKLPVSFHEKPEPELFENCHALIHLAGEPIGERRWSEEVKKRIISSRVNFTHEIIHALKQAKNPPQILIGASAIGIYGNRGDELLSEKSSYETDFLAEVCKRWEESYSDFTGRVVLLRTGVVLGHSGAMEKMLPPFRLFAGGKISNGKQWMSWIHIEDL